MAGIPANPDRKRITHLWINTQIRRATLLFFLSIVSLQTKVKDARLVFSFFLSSTAFFFSPVRNVFLSSHQKKICLDSIRCSSRFCLGSVWGLLFLDQAVRQNFGESEIAPHLLCSMDEDRSCAWSCITTAGCTTARRRIRSQTSGRAAPVKLLIYSACVTHYLISKAKKLHAV